MKRFRRLLLNALGGISLALAIYMGATWASRLLPRGLWIPVRLTLMQNSRRWVSLGDGGNYVYFWSVRFGAPVVGPNFRNRLACASFENSFGVVPNNRWRTVAMSWYRDAPSFATSPSGNVEYIGRETRWMIGFGYFPALFLALPLAWWGPGVVRRMKRRPVEGICTQCGYDLRATPERCPECGAIPAKIANSI